MPSRPRLAPSEGAPDATPGAGGSEPGGLLLRWYRKLFLDHWDAIDAEAARERAELDGRRDSRPLWVLILVALVLVFQEYLGDRPTFHALFPDVGTDGLQAIGEFAWWGGAKIVGYLVVPLVAVWIAGVKLGDCGMSLAGFRRHAWIYAALFGAIFPALVIASRTAAFQSTYPFYKYAARSWTDLVAWEVLYAATFLSLEFFFRGFFLFLLRRSLGHNAIFVMIVPYCMIHFHKPPAEVVGAIFAGIILGTLALRTRSIWCGVLIHVSVAWSMDLLSLAQTTGFPGSGRFIGP